ncbi:MAG: universal stress protein [Deltaproteobacteria bacterium]|nr:MAG: universal stress protein [Deltaproteobacteria bacterium]
MSFPYEKVLVPTDFSDISLQALQVALDATGGDASRLHVVSVLVPVVPPSPGIVWGTVDDQVRLTRVQEALEQLLSERGLAGATPHVVIGTPGTMVADLAKEIDADLVVVTSHGRTGLVRAALGSVAERVVRLSPAPVLVLKASK